MMGSRPSDGSPIEAGRGGAMVRRARWIIGLGLVIGLAAAAAAQSLRVYAVRHRTAEELAPLVESALGGEGRAIADRRTNQIVLTGPPRAVASALEVLAALDVR